MMAIANAVIRGVLVAVVATVLTGAVAAAPKPGDPGIGRGQYEAKCGGCHSVTTNRIGPLHQGVVGRRPGTVPGYAYSQALKRVTQPWTPARLDLWLQGPQKLVPGTKMLLSVPDPVVRANIIAYLMTLSPKPAATQ